MLSYLFPHSVVSFFFLLQYTVRNDAAVFEFLLTSRRNLEILQKYFGQNCQNKMHFIPGESISVQEEFVMFCRRIFYSQVFSFISEIKKWVPALANLTDENFLLDYGELLMGRKYFRSILWILTNHTHNTFWENWKTSLKIRKGSIEIYFVRQTISITVRFLLNRSSWRDEGSKFKIYRFEVYQIIKLYAHNLPTDLRKVVLLLRDYNV